MIERPPKTAPKIPVKHPKPHPANKMKPVPRRVGVKHAAAPTARPKPALQRPEGQSTTVDENDDLWDNLPI
jgi:hypothetical protein